MAAMFFCCSGLKSSIARPCDIYCARPHHHVIAAALVLLLRPVEEPELARNGACVEKVTANIDHHIDRASLDELLARPRATIPPIPAETLDNPRLENGLERPERRPSSN
jgi:hypothetical protein